MTSERLTKDVIVEAARQAAQTLGATFLSRSDFERQTGISQHQLYRTFPEGGWTEVSRLAGLEPHPQRKQTMSDGDLLAEFHRVASLLGDVPSGTLFASRATISDDVLRKRFGGWQGTLKRYRTWLEDNDPDSALLSLPWTRSKHAVPLPPSPPLSVGGAHPTQWNRSDGVEYGPPISFRGLRHAPINEQGVVYLFGMVSYELGFLVEAIHTSFPDCEAKRCVDRNRDRWQRVRIEFEYRSSNFRDHGHDPAGCDVVVCWEHNWLDCPVEVVELRSVLNDLDG